MTPARSYLPCLGPTARVTLPTVLEIAELLFLIGGLGGIAIVMERFTGGHAQHRKSAKQLQKENQELRRALSDVRATSSAAILTGDPVAHQIIVDRIDQEAQRQLEG